ncbi:MAG TPA: pitrilysin family protein [Stellaceae bacterium]|jgi:predicted Zn-dependent peptidase|nr:pitrilysin family protein [Stellaceae bacterium]
MTVTMSRLANGMRVVTDRMDSVETVSIGVWVDVGTRHEPAAINGVAHLLEHMAFKGTQRRSALDIAAEIEAVGGHVNAYTSREHTAYYAKVLKADVALAVDILADILQNSIFDANELERERAVILQEIGQAQDTPDDIIYDLFQECAYPDQPMGQPVLGRSEIVKQLDRDSVAGYMHSTYAAPGMLLVAAGNVSHDALVAAAERSFAALTAHSAAATEPARYVGGDWREERELEQVHVLLGFPGFAFADRDYYAASILSTALGGGMSSRLFQEIREKRGLVYSIYSFSHSYSDGGLFGIYAGTGEDEASELMPALTAEIRRLEAGLEPAELERARAQLKAGLLMSLEGTTARCEQQANHMLVFGRPLDPAELVRHIDAVDEDSVIRVARRLAAAAPTLTALGPIGRIEGYDRLVEQLKP